ncbi:Armadillo repeat-containing protein 3 [Rhizophlyctis rosea]|nr:Armadillo repeat-containing protein 3 [Rhizophlyctis rosea]
MGSAWLRKAIPSISIKHPHDNEEDWELGKDDGEYSDLTAEEDSYGWKDVATFKKLEDYFAADGSLTIVVRMKAQLPSTFVEPTHSIASNSPFAQFFLQEYLSDITIQIVDSHADTDQAETSDSLAAHKLVLSSQSGYFRALFSSGCKESTSYTTNVTDFSVQTMKSLLEFLYIGFLHHHQPHDLDSRLQLIRAADYFQVKDLHYYIANDILMHDLTPSSALKILEFDSSYNLYDLSTQAFTDKNTVVWNYECTLLGVKHRLTRALKKKQSTRIYSNAFGPEGLRFRVVLKCQFKQKKSEHHLGQKGFDMVGIYCNALISNKEKILEDAWTRKACWTITIRHPDPDVNDWVRGDADDDYDDLDSRNMIFGWDIGRVEDLEGYLEVDGSLNVVVRLKAELPSTHVESVEPTIAFSSPFKYLLLQEHLSDSAYPAKAYFKALFNSGCKESSTSSPVIEINNFLVETIQSLLEFLYIGFLHRYKPIDLDTCLQLVRAADYFQVKSLHTYIANEIMMHNLNASSALGILQFASEYEVYNVLVQKVRDWVRSQWDQLVAEDTFRESLREIDGCIIADIFE